MTLPDAQVPDLHLQRLIDHINAFGVPVKMIDHDPTDADFVNPCDGCMAVNYNTNKFFIRILGAWKGVVLA